jgi:hypothetical protein
VTPVGPYYAAVLSGQTVSSAVALARSYRPLVVHCASNGTATSVLLNFSQLSGSPPWSVLNRADGTALPHAIASGTGAAWGVVQYPPTPYLRISLGAATTDVVTFTLIELSLR